MFAPDTLSRQVVLVTGGGSGLGRAMACAFAAHGASVGVLGRRPEPLDQAVEAIREAGGRAARATADVREPQALATAVDALELELGPFTSLVNGAAGNFLCASEDLSPHAFDAVVRTVLHGTFHCTTELGRRWMARRAPGTVLSIATTYAWMGSPFVLPSACAKAGVLALTRSLAVEWAAFGIRLNAIAPGPFPTEGAFSRLMPPGMEEEARAQVPLGRFGNPAELASLAIYLLSPMSAFMTGECVVLDGGEWLRNGQEFGRFTAMPRRQLEEMLALFRSRR